VAIARSGSGGAEVVARSLTVLGRASGKLTARERVELLEGCHVEGRIVTPTIVIDEGAYIRGSVDPTLTDTALAVARHRLRQRDDETL